MTIKSSIRSPSNLREHSKHKESYIQLARSPWSLCFSIKGHQLVIPSLATARKTVLNYKTEEDLARMIRPKKLLKMAKKWQKEASKSALQRKGHFVIYTVDQSRFVIPLVYLSSNIFRELFRMSEDEFGLPRNGPITLPCDSGFMKYIVNIIECGATKDLETALMSSIAMINQCSLQQQLLVCGC